MYKGHSAQHDCHILWYTIVVLMNEKLSNYVPYAAYTHPKITMLEQVGILQLHDQQADNRMRSHGLRQLVDGRSVASCQQLSCCRLIIKTCYPLTYRQFQQVLTSLQMTSFNKPDSTQGCDKLKLTRLLASTNKLVKLIDNLQQVCGFFVGVRQRNNHLRRISIHCKMSRDRFLASAFF